VIPNDALINAVRHCGFAHKKESQRMTLWKQRGTTRRVEIIKRDLHDEGYARSVLRQAGMPAAEIENFIRSTTTGRN
jgi:hypothetical protein